jgi:hypothetical protein
MTDASTASIGGPNLTGWSIEDLFVHYVQHFITCKKACKEDPALLILALHIIPPISMAKVNETVMITLPVHTSHKLQPLDFTVLVHIMLALMAGSLQTHANLKQFPVS